MNTAFFWTCRKLPSAWSPRDTMEDKAARPSVNGSPAEPPHRGLYVPE